MYIYLFINKLKYINHDIVCFHPVLLHTATANGFQMVTSGAQSKAVSDWAITSLEVSITDSRRDSFTHKQSFCHHILALMSFQTHVSSFVLWTKNEDVLKNVHAALCFLMNVNCDQKLSNSRKNLCWMF